MSRRRVGHCPPYAYAYCPRRFWEHTIRSEPDLETHMDYVHYNPVKHEHARCPHAWPWSSFQHWVRAGRYPPDWMCTCTGPKRKPPGFGEVEGLLSEWEPQGGHCPPYAF